MRNIIRSIIFIYALCCDCMGVKPEVAFINYEQPIYNRSWQWSAIPKADSVNCKGVALFEVVK